MSNAKKTIGFSVFGALLVAAAIYTGLWFWMATEIRTQVSNFLVESRKNNVQILVRSLDIKGFPGTHEVHISGRIAADNAIAEVPELIARSHFFPGQRLTIELPQGFSIVEPVDSKLWSADRVYIDTIIPESLPDSMTHEDLAVWRDADQSITLNDIEIEKETLKAQGHGTVFLDDALQPAGNFSAHATGYMDFLQWLKQNHYIQTKEALLSSAVLSGLSKKDEDGNIYMDVDLTLQNQTLFVGPLRLAYLPSVRWAWRNALDPLQ